MSAWKPHRESWIERKRLWKRANWSASASAAITARPGTGQNFSEKKSAALQAALDAYSPKLSSLAEMIRFYETVSPSLDPQGFTLFRAAKR